ncbi:unnamed protein product, partial [Ixodes hexagonus]
MVRTKRIKTARVRKIFSSSSEDDSSDPDMIPKGKQQKTVCLVDSTRISDVLEPNSRASAASPSAAEEATEEQDTVRINAVSSDNGSFGAVPEPSTSGFETSKELCRTSVGQSSSAVFSDTSVVETPPAKQRLNLSGLQDKFWEPKALPQTSSTPKATASAPSKTPPVITASPEQTASPPMPGEITFSQQSSCDEQVRDQVSAIIDTLPGVDAPDSPVVSGGGGASEKSADSERPLKGAKVHVEVHCGRDDISGTLGAILEKLGAQVCSAMGPEVTHVVFRKGSDSTRNMALQWNIPLVGPLWVEGCRVQRRAVSPDKYPAVAREAKKRRLLHVKQRSRAVLRRKKKEGWELLTRRRHIEPACPPSPAATPPRSLTLRSQPARLPLTPQRPSTSRQPSASPEKVRQPGASRHVRRSARSKRARYQVGNDENSVAPNTLPSKRGLATPDGTTSGDSDFAGGSESSGKRQPAFRNVEVPKVHKRAKATVIQIQDCKLPPGEKDSRPSVVMTSVPLNDQEAICSIVLALGLFQVEADVTERTTHLVVGAGGVRTLKLLFAMARGCWVLSTNWVYRSLESGRWLDEAPFELDTMFPAVQLSRQNRMGSRRGCSDQGLLAGMGSFYVSPKSHPPQDKLRELVEIVGGKLALSYLRCNVALGPVEATKRQPDIRHVSEKWLL